MDVEGELALRPFVSQRSANSVIAPVFRADGSLKINLTKLQSSGVSRAPGRTCLCKIDRDVVGWAGSLPKASIFPSVMAQNQDLGENLRRY
jgi:hypothetical protein